MSGKFLARASALSLAFVLAACGGDDSSTPLAGGGNGGSGGNGSDSGDSPTETQTQFCSIDILANPIRLNTSTSASSEITARVKSDNGVLLADIPVTFSAPQGGTLQVSQGITDEAGIATAKLTV